MTSLSCGHTCLFIPVVESVAFFFASLLSAHSLSTFVVPKSHDGTYLVGRHERLNVFFGHKVNQPRIIILIEDDFEFHLFFLAVAPNHSLQRHTTMNVARDESDDFLVFIRDDVNADFGTHLSHEVGHDDAVEPRSQEAYNDQSDIVDEECRTANGASRNADRCTEIDVHVFVDNFAKMSNPPVEALMLKRMA